MYYGFNFNLLIKHLKKKKRGPVRGPVRIRADQIRTVHGPRGPVRIGPQKNGPFFSKSGPL